MKPLILLFLFSSINLLAQGIKAIPDCNGVSDFVKQQGLNPLRSGFSTSEKKAMGLVCIEFGANNAPVKSFQHPTWRQAGFLAPIAISATGAVYTAPAPNINTYYNAPSKQNILYKVNPKNGEMKAILELPSLKKPTPQNAFGILGLAYDCENNNLYATSVMGSDRENEVGQLFSLSTTNDKVTILDKLSNIDAIGIGVAYFNGQKRVFFGKARTSDIYSVGIDFNGKFVGLPRLETTLAELGLRGDDRARKIRFTPDGKMIIKGIEFYFNLIAPTEKQESTYTFKYNLQNNKWEIEQISTN